METSDNVTKSMSLQRLIMKSLNETLLRRRFCNVVRRFHGKYMATSERRWIATPQQRCNNVIVSTGRGISETPATPKTEFFVILVDGWRPQTNNDAIMTAMVLDTFLWNNDYD